MPSPATELYKDKVEISLDGRQIFYLFFGGAVIVGIVFVLGVLVGRRVEARGHVDRARTTAAADPLAALDRLEGSGEMSFRGALTGKEPTAPVEKKIEQIAAEKKKGDKSESKSDGKSETKSDSKSDTKSESKSDAKSDAKSETKSESKSETKSESKSEGKSEGKSESKSETKSEAKSDAKKTEDKSEQASADKPILKPSEKAADKPAEEKTRYTLQLSSFQDKSEAEAYLAKMKDQGFQAQITQAEVEGKGTFYRVRMGSYRSLESATTAKSDFEKASSKSASIMKL